MCGAGTLSQERGNLQKARWTSELFVRPRDPKWKTCVTLQICVTWQAGTRQELRGLLGFPPPFIFLAVILILFKNPPFPVIWFPTSFFHLSEQPEREASCAAESCSDPERQNKTHSGGEALAALGSCHLPRMCPMCIALTSPHSKGPWWITPWTWMLTRSSLLAFNYDEKMSYSLCADLNIGSQLDLIVSVPMEY